MSTATTTELAERMDAAWTAVMRERIPEFSLRVTLEDLPSTISGCFGGEVFDLEELRPSEDDAYLALAKPIRDRYAATCRAALETFRAELEAAVINFMAAHPDAPLKAIES